MDTRTDINFAALDRFERLPDWQRATVYQFGSLDDFLEVAPDIAEYGAGGGWSGFIYYSDTVPFGRAWAPDILAHLAELAEDCGESLADCLAAFRCIHASASEIILVLAGDDPEGDSATEVYNGLAWYALEETARALAGDEDDCDIERTLVARGE